MGISNHWKLEYVIVTATCALVRTKLRLKTVPARGRRDNGVIATDLPGGVLIAGRTDAGACASTAKGSRD